MATVHAGGPPIEFAVEYEHRNTEKFDRNQVISAFVDCIKQPPHKVGLDGGSLRHS